MSGDNLFADPPTPLPEEWVEVLVRSGDARLERIVSLGHAIPPGRWYDQDTSEWVVLLRGAAVLRFEDEPTAGTAWSGRRRASPRPGSRCMTDHLGGTSVDRSP